LAAYFAEHKDDLREKQRDYQKRNRKRANKRNAAYAKRNRAKRNAMWARWRAAKRRATPAWADLKTIEAIYVEAAQRTKETGVSHHVDHIYPLQSPIMCGLHAETNLQILTALENVRKHNHVR
jgi:hypothetical protein